MSAISEQQACQPDEEGERGPRIAFRVGCGNPGVAGGLRAAWRLNSAESPVFGALGRALDPSLYGNNLTDAVVLVLPSLLGGWAGQFLLAVVAAGYVFVRWYANDNWYVALDGNSLAIYQGRPGGFLWFHPELVDRTTVTTDEVVPTRLTALEADVQEPTLGAARRYVRNLHQEYVSIQQLRNGVSTAPSTTAPSTTAPAGAAG